PAYYWLLTTGYSPGGTHDADLLGAGGAVRRVAAVRARTEVARGRDASGGLLLRGSLHLQFRRRAVAQRLLPYCLRLSVQNGALWRGESGRLDRGGRGGREGRSRVSGRPRHARAARGAGKTGPGGLRAGRGVFRA